MASNFSSNSDYSASDLRSVMLLRYDPLLGGSDLAQALGYRNLAALREAKRVGRLGVTVFHAPGRKGLYALTHEIADWLQSIRSNSEGETAV